MGECPISQVPRSLPQHQGQPTEAPRISELSDDSSPAPSLRFSSHHPVCVLCPPAHRVRTSKDVAMFLSQFKVLPVHQTCLMRVTSVAPAGMEGCPLLLPSWLKGTCQALHSGAHSKDKPLTKLPFIFFSVFTQNLEIKMKPSNAENSFIQ